MRIKFKAVVENVGEHTETYDHKFDGSYKTRSLGWFIRCLGSSAIGPFDSNMGFKKGDEIWISVEKVKPILYKTHPAEK